MPACTHLDEIGVEQIAEADKRGLVCEDCVREGTDWLHLRQCLTCGGIRCCDDSPRRHARRHAGAVGHPIIASAQPGERWRYCFVDDVEV